MKKNILLRFMQFTFYLWGGVFICIVLFSCKNFLGGEDLKQELLKELEYAKSKSLTVNVECSQDSGVISSGSIVYCKKSDEIKIIFKQNEHTIFQEIKFLKNLDGVFIQKDRVFTLLDSVFNESKNQWEFLCRVDEYEENMYIKIECISVKIQPAYDKKNGVPRDSEIVIQFSKDIEDDLIDLDIAPIDLKDKFNDPVYNSAEKTLIITPKNTLKFDDKLKEVNFEVKNIFEKGTYESENNDYVYNNESENNNNHQTAESPLDSEIEDIVSNTEDNNNSLVTEKNENKIEAGIVKFTYIINSSTKAQFKVSIDGQNCSITPRGVHSFNTNVPVSLKCFPNNGYSFIRWDTSSTEDELEIENIYSNETIITPKKDVSGAFLMAVCAQDLVLRDFSPKVASGESVPKNSLISLTFNKDVEIDTSSNERIKILFNGEDISDSFSDPLVSNNMVSLNPQKYLSLSDSTAKIKVEIPQNYIYYNFDNNTKVYLESTINEYTVNDSTIEKVNILFSSPADIGTVTPSGNQSFNITQQSNLKFDYDDNRYKFFNWSITYADSGEEVPETIIKIDDSNSKTTSVHVNGKTDKLININPIVYKRPEIQNITPNVNIPVNYPKNSDIIIEFNCELEENQDLSKIELKIDGVSLIGNNYYPPVINGKYILIKPYEQIEKLIEIQNNKTKKVDILVPSTLYLKEGNNKIEIGSDKKYSFYIDQTTVEKAELFFDYTDYGTLNYEFGNHVFYKGDIINLQFLPNNNGYFNCWFIEDA